MTLPVNNALNPYESPAYPVDETLLGDDREVIATFMMHEADQRACALVLNVPIAKSGFVALATAIPLAVLCPFILPDSGLFIALLLGLFAVGAFFVAQFQWTQRFRAAAVEKMRSHPLLAATGVWRLTLDPDRVILETPSGVQGWSRRRTPIWNDGDQLVFWLDQLPVVIPQHEPYGPMCHALRQWLWKWSQQDQS